MRMRTILVVLAIFLIAAFAAANWPVFVAPTRLSLVFTSFEAPLGLLMLVILMAVVLGFVGYMALWQGKTLLEFRRSAKELERQRDLADQAEASRFTALQATMQSDNQQLTARFAQLQEAIGAEIRENANSLAATLAEMDDRLKAPGRI